MSRQIVLEMARALPGIKEDGESISVDEAWEVTLHAGRLGSGMNVPQVTKITVLAEYLVCETHKGQRVVLKLDEVRGFIADPSSVDRSRSRKTGFV